MKTKNAEYQESYKKRMRDDGLSMVTLWIQPDRKEMLKSFADALRAVENPQALKK